uniref:Uncharacterized protein n=1 Tax=Parascaris equorum TaxID=6256 RepID=A0A914R4D0_PAREQ
LGSVKAITRVTYHRSRDPRQRPRTGANALPLPRVGMLPVPNLARVSSGSNLKDMTNEGRPADVQKKTQPEKEVTDEQRCYSPSQAISDEALSAGPSSPAELASPDQSSSTAFVDFQFNQCFFSQDESRTLKLKIPTVTLDDKGDVLSITNESPASPPIEKNVYVAQAPKIISGSDLRPPCGQSLHTSSHTYKFLSLLIAL